MKGEEYKIYLSDEQYDECVDYANKIHEQKKNYESCTPFSPNYELVGAMGEKVFSLLSGLPMNKKILIGGDNGLDFKYNVQVKTSEEHKAKHLIEYIDKFDKLITTSPKGYYVFVIVNLEEKYGYVCGIISFNEFRKKLRIMNFKYGDRYAVELSELHEYIPKIYKNIEL
jgi:hypothetical protein